LKVAVFETLVVGGKVAFKCELFGSHGLLLRSFVLWDVTSCHGVRSAPRFEDIPSKLRALLTPQHSVASQKTRIFSILCFVDRASWYDPCK